MTHEVLTSKRSKLKKINHDYLETTEKLLLKDQEKLEHCNHVLGKRLTQLKNINDECHQHIGKLQDEVARIDKTQIEENEIDDDFY